MSDSIDKIINDEVTKRTDLLVQIGVYLEPDLADMLAALGKKGGRGAKSHIVNEALRKLFREKGLM